MMMYISLNVVCKIVVYINGISRVSVFFKDKSIIYIKTFLFLFPSLFFLNNVL